MPSRRHKPQKLLEFNDVSYKVKRPNQHIMVDDFCISELVTLALGMKLSREKCKFRQTEITYLGERLTLHGVKPDVEKLKAINDYAKPSNKQDVQCLLRMVNFIAKFGMQVCKVTAPLHELIKKNISFDWLDIHDKAFSDLKSILTDSQAL